MQNVENAMMTTLEQFPGTLTSSSLRVTIPRSFFFDANSCIQVIEDLFPAVNLTSLLSLVIFRNQQEVTALGAAIGSWLRAFHDWTSEPPQIGLRRDVARRCEPMRKLKRQITYGSLFAVLQSFPMILEKHKSVLNQIQQLAVAEFQKQWREDDQDVSAWGVIHGDFWGGK